MLKTLFIAALLLASAIPPALAQMVGPVLYPDAPDTSQLEKFGPPVPPGLLLPAAVPSKAAAAPATAAAANDTPFPCKPPAHDLSQVPDSVRKTYQQRDEAMQAMDTNCDGVLEPAELHKGVTSGFAAADTDKDGVISPQEAAAMVDQFKVQNQDTGGLLVDKHAKTLEKRVGDMDTDGDGVISAQEYQTYYNSRYQALDKDKDGAIDIGEYKTDTESHHHRREH